MKLQTLVLGPIQTNCYLLFSSSNNVIVIDPADNPEKILQSVGDSKINYIISTHGHFDHITAAMKLRQMTKSPFLIHKADSFMFPQDLVVDTFLVDGMLVNLDDIVLKVIHTPGHTPGSVCLYDEKNKNLFSGDTLFYADHGRCDLPLSSYSDIVLSLKKLFDLPSDTIVYPGHGPQTTIFDEKNRGLI